MWDGDIVIYNEETGHTQAFNSFGREIFEALLDSPLDEPEIHRRVAGAAGMLEDEAVAKRIAVTIGEFRRLNLIQPA